MGAPSSDGKLRDLPRTARNQQPAVAQGADAAGVRFLPRYKPSSYCPNFAECYSRFQPGLHQLPFQNPRVEPPVGGQVPALGGRAMRVRAKLFVFGIITI